MSITFIFHVSANWHHKLRQNCQIKFRSLSVFFSSLPSPCWVSFHLPNPWPVMSFTRSPSSNIGLTPTGCIIQNPVIRRIQFGARNILCDSKDNIQLKTNKFNLSNSNGNGRNGIENIKKEVSVHMTDALTFLWCSKKCSGIQTEKEIIQANSYEKKKHIFSKIRFGQNIQVKGNNLFEIIIMWQRWRIERSSTTYTKTWFTFLHLHHTLTHTKHSRRTGFRVHSKRSIRNGNDMRAERQKINYSWHSWHIWS